MILLFGVLPGFRLPLRGLWFDVWPPANPCPCCCPRRTRLSTCLLQRRKQGLDTKATSCRKQTLEATQNQHETEYGMYFICCICSTQALLVSCDLQDQERPCEDQCSYAFAFEEASAHTQGPAVSLLLGVSRI